MERWIGKHTPILRHGSHLSARPMVDHFTCPRFECDGAPTIKDTEFLISSDVSWSCPPFLSLFVSAPLRVSLALHVHHFCCAPPPQPQCRFWPVTDFNNMEFNNAGVSIYKTEPTSTHAPSADGSESRITGVGVPHLHHHYLRITLFAALCFSTFNLFTIL